MLQLSSFVTPCQAQPSASLTVESFAFNVRVAVLSIENPVILGVTAVRFDHIDLRFGNMVVLIDGVIGPHQVSEQCLIAFNQTHGALSLLLFIVHDIPNNK